MNQRTAPQHLKPDSHGLSINGDAGRAGSRCVREVQLALNRALGLRLSPTGYLDAPSRSALRSYQRRCGLPATGRLGPGTRLAISRHIPAPAADDDEIEQFLGKLVRGVGRGVSQAAKTVGRTASTVARVVPLAQLASAASRAVPFSAAVRGVWGGVAAGLAGKNVLTGAVRAALPTAMGKFAFDAGRAVLRGDKLSSAVKQAAGAGIADVREQLRFAQMVAPFVPGVGTGVAAALGAANALSEGRPITQALLAAARGALPGGVVAQTGFDVAINLAQGKNITAAALAAARRALPGGALARAAFDTAVALAEGKRLQDAAIAAAGRAAGRGPLGAVARGLSGTAIDKDIAAAALSGAGRRLIATSQGQFGQRS